MDLKESELLGDEAANHWYYVSKGRALKRLLDNHPARRVLDVGAGSGAFSRQLLDAGLAQSATCVDVGYARDWSEQHHGKSIEFVRRADAKDQDLVLLMDVLEHVDDDRALLNQYTESLAPGSRVVITVPAFQWLWSGHDVFLEHRRRYTLPEVETLVRDCGLVVQKRCYFFGALFPAVAAMRFKNRLVSLNRDHVAKTELKDYAPWLNALLTHIHTVERLTFFPANRLAGLTVFCLATRT